MYHAELAHLYGSPHPHGRLLSSSSRFISVQHVWHLPSKRTLMWPHFSLCPLHHIELRNTCQCGWHSGHFQGGRRRLPALHAGWIGVLPQRQTPLNSPETRTSELGSFLLMILG